MTTSPPDPEIPVRVVRTVFVAREGGVIRVAHISKENKPFMAELDLTRAKQLHRELGAAIDQITGGLRRD